MFNTFLILFIIVILFLVSSLSSHSIFLSVLSLLLMNLFISCILLYYGNLFVFCIHLGAYVSGVILSFAVISVLSPFSNNANNFHFTSLSSPLVLGSLILPIFMFLYIDVDVWFSIDEIAVFYTNVYIPHSDLFDTASILFESNIYVITYLCILIVMSVLIVILWYSNRK